MMFPVWVAWWCQFIKLQTQTVVSNNVLQPITTSNKISCLSNLLLVLSVCALNEIWESESRIGLDKTGNCSFSDFWEGNVGLD